jgi:hypothetical protein
MATEPAVQKIFKESLHTEEEDICNHKNKGKINFTRRVHE